MFKVPRVEQGEFYVTRIIKAMQLYAQNEKEKIVEQYKKTPGLTKDKTKEEVQFNKRKDLELAKIRYIKERLPREMRKISSKYPNFTRLDEIYIKLINTSETPVKQIKDAVDTLNYIAKTIEEYSETHERKIKHAKSQQTADFVMKKYLGKVNSLYRKNKPTFKTLEKARGFLNKLPVFEDLYTVAIAGFPNVGKSTLMNKLTGVEVEVQSYPFTTKGLMFGYLEHNNNKVIQMIDTPGLLNREAKDNPIEERAKIVLTEYCDSILFVIDITESCGYTVDQQMKLFKKAKLNQKPLIIYFSKTDIYDEEDDEVYEEVTKKLKSHKQYKDVDELRKKLVDLFLQKGETFDPSKLKVLR